MRHPFIVGEHLYLRGLTRDDLGGNMFNWANDAEVTRYMFMGAVPNTPQSLEREYDSLAASQNDVVLAVVDTATDAHIGNTGLYAINWISRLAEYRIIIGEKDYWGRGYGTEAARLTVAYGFEKLNLNCIFLGVNAEHAAAIRSYEKAGFVHEGKMRQIIYRNGRYYDGVRLSMLREEYFAGQAGA
jgi:[ribosomal protein S5]-alanine N-acetyltransferase